MQIKSTRNYTMFNHITGNRNINRAHVKRLELAFKQRPQRLQWNPIIVNENHEIIDGQHRFEVAQRLDAPVYYRVISGLTLTDCQDLNSNSKMWTPNDYARAYSQNGNEAYTKYIEFRSDYGLNHDVALRYLSLEEPITSQAFKEGYLEVPDYKRSQQYAEMLLEAGEYVIHIKLRAIAVAYLELLMEGLNHKKMMKKLKKVGVQVAKYTQNEEAQTFFREIYNS